MAGFQPQFAPFVWENLGFIHLNPLPDWIVCSNILWSSEFSCSGIFVGYFGGRQVQSWNALHGAFPDSTLVHTTCPQLFGDNNSAKKKKPLPVEKMTAVTTVRRPPKSITPESSQSPCMHLPERTQWCAAEQPFLCRANISLRSNHFSSILRVRILLSRRGHTL